MSKTKIYFGALGALFVLIQLIPVNRENPPVENEISVPAEIDGILHRACYDCHSNETVWPWYSYVAPVSWFVANHVHEGRGELNFSEFASYTARRADHKLEEMEEMVRKGEMPLPVYLPLHSNAELSEHDKELLYAWVAEMRTSLVDRVEAERRAQGEPEPEHDDGHEH